ncbi:lysosomal alpha-glucosidase-like [Octopus sinensis]|uniref:Lysosomal alpha-glucosidase-like n=1 Tax=Octopus sinensis TaxID=2607531 RepID=A0A6P7TEE8_9MOLL|nr:lysosomal alpha-glucosidase-like [Octopus sinensis]
MFQTFACITCFFSITTFFMYLPLQYLSDCYFQQTDHRDSYCSIATNDRFDCHPESGASEKSCKERGCCWDEMSEFACFYPKHFVGYIFNKSAVTKTGYSYGLSRSKPSPFPKDIAEIQMDVYFETKTRLHIKIYDPHHTRYEIPFKVPKADKRAQYVRYSFKTSYIGEPFQFNVSRFDPLTEAAGTTLLETKGSLIFADQFLQLSYQLPSKYIYGLGEHHLPLLLPLENQKLTFWNKDHVPEDALNLYGSHPFYLVLEEDGTSHGVYIHNSNAMDVILHPFPALTWRTIGGILDMYVFLGPKPNDVIQQYTEVIGRPFMPPYWSLGFHLCRYGYPTANRTLEVMNRVRKAGIPQDVQWNDIDYMYKERDFTLDPQNFGNQSALVKEIHSRGMKYIILIDPGIYAGPSEKPYIPFQLGKKMDIFVKDSTGKENLIGKVWPGITAFPDFTHPRINQYWQQLIGNFHKLIPFDGLWLDMNEISNFVTGSIHGCPKQSPYENPPYLPAVRGRALKFSTLCASAQQYLSSQYNLHNLYGITETKVSYSAMVNIRKKRPFLISRSTFSGSGRYGGHWTGDNSATYKDMASSVTDIINFNLFGIPMVGADICGFNEETTKELCQRWYQLGAFYPFSRSHNCNKLKDQDPAAFDKAFSESTKKAYMTRYSLLPYLYTLFYKSHANGSAVVRPLFYDFPNDKATYTLDTQFFWGSSLLISPVLQSDVQKVAAYFPQGKWYNFYTGEYLIGVSQSFFLLNAPMDVINVHLQGGAIIPLQEPALTTTTSRQNPFTLLSALDASGRAFGELYWDDGESLSSVPNGVYNMIHFFANETTLYNSVIKAAYLKEPMTLRNITIFGIPSQPTSVLFNRFPVPFSFQPHTKVLYVPRLNSGLLVPFQLTWSFAD